MIEIIDEDRYLEGMHLYEHPLFEDLLDESNIYVYYTNPAEDYLKDKGFKSYGYRDGWRVYKKDKVPNVKSPKTDVTWVGQYDNSNNIDNLRLLTWKQVIGDDPFPPTDDFEPETQGERREKEVDWDVDDDGYLSSKPQYHYDPYGNPNFWKGRGNKQ